MSLDPLSETLKLEQLEVNLFRGTTPPGGMKRIYGGQVIAQSLMAAYATVENRTVHSLHCYFIRPGDPSIPIIFEVDRSRDGGSFTTRRVVAIQHGQQIFNFAASFQTPEQGFEHQAPMPPHEALEDAPDEVEATRRALVKDNQDAARWLSARRPIELRGFDGLLYLGEGEAAPENKLWFRARDPIAPADTHMHAVILAYASDMGLLGTALLPHPARWNTPGMQVASLDHAMWFHRPLNFNDWHLYTTESTSASGGRGFVRGAIYTQDGVLVASAAQEGLIRARPAR